MPGLPRTPDQLRAAVDTMCRVRAGESPPDANGQRILWHRGSKGADLTTHVDSDGVVFRQELQLFDDYFVWDALAGLRTGVPVEAAEMAGARVQGDYVLDVAEKSRIERLQRAHQALKHYGNADKSIGHFKRVIDQAVTGADVTSSQDAVTRNADKVRYDNYMSQSQRIRLDAINARLAMRTRRRVIWAAAAGLALAAMAALALWPGAR